MNHEMITVVFEVDEAGSSNERLVVRPINVSRVGRQRALTVSQVEEILGHRELFLDGTDPDFEALEEAEDLFNSRDLRPTMLRSEMALE